jgi:hypothetical protein
VDTSACLFGDLGRRKSAPRRHASRPAGDAHHEAQTRAIAFHGLKRAVSQKSSQIFGLKSLLAAVWVAPMMCCRHSLLPNGVAKKENNSGKQRQRNPGRNPSDTKNENNSG